MFFSYHRTLLLAFWIHYITFDSLLLVFRVSLPIYMIEIMRREKSFARTPLTLKNHMIAIEGIKGTWLKYHAVHIYRQKEKEAKSCSNSSAAAAAHLNKIICSRVYNTHNKYPTIQRPCLPLREQHKCQDLWNKQHLKRLNATICGRREKS